MFDKNNLMFYYCVMNDNNDNKLQQSVLNVMREVCYGKNITRPEIAQAVGLTTMSISNIVKELINLGVIDETRDMKSTGLGRKPTILGISDRCPHIIAINLTRGEFLVAEMDFRANIVSRQSVSVPTSVSAESVMDLIFSMVDKAVESASSRICALGISCFGPVDTENGIIFDPGDFSGIEELVLKQPLEERYSLPCVVIHDSNASALAEKRFGALKDIHSFLYIRDVAGIGCGLILNDEIFSGDSGLSGEFGLLGIEYGGEDCPSGLRGSLGQYACLKVIADRINRMHNFNPPLTIEDIVGLYNSEQVLFESFFEEWSDRMAYAIAGIVNVLDISSFVLEYRGQEKGNRMERVLQDKVRKLLPKRRNPVNVYKSTFGDAASLIGACSAVIDALTSGEISIEF